MQAFHQTNARIPIGEVITSNQHYAASYALVWRIYKEVADSLGKYFPPDFGYAYPFVHTNSSADHIYTVTAPDEFVTQGNAHFSVYHVMASLSSRYGVKYKSLPEEEKLRVREAVIRTCARAYFVLVPADENFIELISDKFIVEVQNA